MKTLQLKTLPLLLVELPEGYRITDLDGYTDGRRYVILYSDTEPERYKKMPDESEWIGKLSELPDWWFEQHVETSEYYEPQDPYTPIRLFKGYCDNIWKRTPRESFYTLLEAKEQVYLNGNPYRDYTRYIAGSNPYVVTKERYNEAQSRTFDPARTYIFTVKTEEK